jgi:hypothetical protein
MDIVVVVHSDVVTIVGSQGHMFVNMLYSEEKQGTPQPMKRRENEEKERLYRCARQSAQRVFLPNGVSLLQQ